MNSTKQHSTKQQTITIRTATGDYGSGKELQITAYAVRLADMDLDEDYWETMDMVQSVAGMNWTIQVDGIKRTIQAGGGIISANPVELDYDGEGWRSRLSAEQPTASDLSAVLADEAGYVEQSVAAKSGAGA